MAVKGTHVRALILLHKSLSVSTDSSDVFEKAHVVQMENMWMVLIY